MNLKENISLFEKISRRFISIYGSEYPDLVTELVRETEKVKKLVKRRKEKWTEKDVVLITYGDSIKKTSEKPLVTLCKFAEYHFRNIISHIHILPYFPYSSDDGFSIKDYYTVNPEFGNWDDVRSIAQNFGLMTDLVINHVSQYSTWFKNYLKTEDPGKDYFIEADPLTNLSAVVRPRSLPLLTEVKTAGGTKHVWTTFSADQIDLNFQNPAVLLEMMKVFLFYLSKGAVIIRLDAIAFLWKELGTSCLHLPQTHEVVKLMRDLADSLDPSLILITETNVPNNENLSYFGHGDEAHMVYQFSLPPLLLHALYRGTSHYLNRWIRSLSDIPSGCTFFNFTASHDGIGVRPLEGILPENEIRDLISAMKDFGGHISTKRNKDGSDSPYEMNITYLDALKFTSLGRDDLQIERFICSQTLMMSFQGIPAFYIHSLLGTHNFNEGVEATGMNRTINRRKWKYEELNELLMRGTSHSRIMRELLQRISIRKKVPAFHPESQQEIMEAGDKVFVMTRGNSGEMIVVVNLTSENYSLENSRLKVEVLQRKDLLNPKTAEEYKLLLGPYQVMWLQKKRS